MSPDARSPDLWTFALACYARPGVEAACLELQTAGADVCLLLCGAWLQARGIACTGEKVAGLQTVATAWQRDVVTPLRRLRMQWREGAQHDAQLATLRESLKALELKAERTLLERLQQASEDWPAGTAAEHWLRRLAPVAGATREPSLERLRAAAVEVQLSLAG